jgi:SAM-dependent methyltransferase
VGVARDDPRRHPLPTDLVACAAATLPRDGAPILVCCEHGVRSRMAARFLADVGFPRVLNMSGGMSTWTGVRQFEAHDIDPVVGPSSWLLASADLLQPESTCAQGEPAPRKRALDVACGRGRHALLLAIAGLDVRAVDRGAEAVAGLRWAAGRLGLPIAAATSISNRRRSIWRRPHDVIVCIHYPHRPLFPALHRALKPGGVLIYDLTTAQATREADQPGASSSRASCRGWSRRSRSCASARGSSRPLRGVDRGALTD